jgi:hypothetical protein
MVKVNVQLDELVPGPLIVKSQSAGNVLVLNVPEPEPLQSRISPFASTTHADTSEGQRLVSWRVAVP